MCAKQQRSFAIFKSPKRCFWERLGGNFYLGSFATASLSKSRPSSQTPLHFTFEPVALRPSSYFSLFRWKRPLHSGLGWIAARELLNISRNPTNRIVQVRGNVWLLAGHGTTLFVCFVPINSVRRPVCRQAVKIVAIRTIMTIDPASSTGKICGFGFNDDIERG